MSITALDEQNWAHRNEGEPWIGYDGHNVTRIAGFLAKSAPTLARAVREYECAHQDRPEVIAAADRRLAKLHA